MKLTSSLPALSRSEKLWPGARSPDRIDRRSSSVTSSATERDAMGRTGAEGDATSRLALERAPEQPTDINYSEPRTARKRAATNGPCSGYGLARPCCYNI